MKKSDDIVLSLCIPTYNRSKYIEKSLNALFKTNVELSPSIEVLIADNSENDETSQLIDDFIKKGNSIDYFHHDRNIGPDQNFNYLFKKARGSFVLLLGDDDFINSNDLNSIVFLLNNNKECGIVHINRTYTYDKIHNSKQLNFNRVSSESLINEANLWLTHISSNIYNKSLLTNFNFENNYQNYFPHLIWLNKILENSTCHLILNNKLVFCTPRNSINYDIFNTFSIDLILVIDSLEWQGNLKHLFIDKLKKVLLLSFFPQFLIFNRKTSSYSKLPEKKLVDQIIKNLNYKILYSLNIKMFPYTNTLIYRFINKIIRIIFL